MVKIEDYRLPVHDMDVERRNFPGCQVNQYYTLSEIVMGDESGTTETDSQTDKPQPNYSTINRTMGKKSIIRTKSSSPETN